MRLVAFGCSNTFGQALPDIWDHKKNECIFNQGPSKYAWPQLLANKLDIECVNISKPGASNKEIWYNIVNTEFKKNDIVIILWPGRSRWCIIKDLVLNTATDHSSIEDFNNRKVEKIGPFNFDKKQTSVAFYKYLFNEQDFRIDYLMRVNYVRMLLKNKIKILKHYETDGELARHNRYPKWFDSNIEKVDFTQVVNTYPKALDNGHAGEEGNKAFADILYKQLQEQDPFKRYIASYI